MAKALVLENRQIRFRSCDRSRSPSSYSCLACASVIMLLSDVSEQQKAYTCSLKLLMFLRTFAGMGATL